MSILPLASVERPLHPASSHEIGLPAEIHASLEALRQCFAVDFSVLDPASEQWLHRGADQPLRDWLPQVEICGAMIGRGRAELIAEEGPLAILAIPLANRVPPECVAVAAFVAQPVAGDIAAAAEKLGLRVAETVAWAERQPVWQAQMLLKVAELAAGKWAAEKRAIELQREVHDLSIHLASTYEEISLLHRLTQNLKISGRVEDLARMTLEWLAEVIPAQGLLVQLFVPATGSAAIDKPNDDAILCTQGECSLDNFEFERLIAHLDAEKSLRPIVVNRPLTVADSWPFPGIRELILAPLVEGDNLFGWVAGINHRLGAEFGTIEASLLGSVGAILGIHGGNIELYRQQAEFLAGVVRALTSAIDAKDPYTCGHSDRVARIAVRLAEDLGCDEEQLKSIYLSGLLHDIGKIGINDNVLRKPGKLTDAEFEHIKSHTDIGFKILKDLKQLDEVLPVVRHHHESWDGRGYPCGLADFEIPFMARIVAVADAFDAMSSDRPYRPGMPDDKIDEIMRGGAGKQWDAAIIDAFFRAREDLRQITCRNEEWLPRDLGQFA